MGGNDVIMERVLYVGSLVLSTIQPAKVRVVFGEEQFGLYDIIRVPDEVASRPNWRRGRKTVEMRLVELRMLRSDAIDIIPSRCAH